MIISSMNIKKKKKKPQKKRRDGVVNREHYKRGIRGIFLQYDSNIHTYIIVCVVGL